MRASQTRKLGWSSLEGFCGFVCQLWASTIGPLFAGGKAVGKRHNGIITQAAVERSRTGWAIKPPVEDVITAMIGV